ncbi:MAG: membrane-associated protein [Bacteroidetes bacterium]|nr:membrane-associated protein [Bacteroidota bacterium]
MPIWFKVLYTSFVLVLIPVYWKHYGPANFLWFSDISLFTLAFALWFQSSILTSMMALGVLFPEIVWNIDYFARLIFGKKLIGLSHYMFEKDKPLFLRALSLFHVIIPPLLLWMLMLYGYSENAPFFQTILAWIVLAVCYFFTTPLMNINWVFGPGSIPQNKISPKIYFLLILLFFPICIYLPIHFLLRYIFN